MRSVFHISGDPVCYLCTLLVVYVHKTYRLCACVWVQVCISACSRISRYTHLPYRIFFTQSFSAISPRVRWAEYSIMIYCVELWLKYELHSQHDRAWTKKKKKLPLRMFKNKNLTCHIRGIVKGSQTGYFLWLAILWFYLGCCFSFPLVSPSPLSLCDPYHCSPEREERWQTNLFIISRFSWLNCYPSWTL